MIAMKRMIPILFVLPLLTHCTVKEIASDDDFIAKAPKYVSYLDRNITDKAAPDREIAQAELDKVEVNTPSPENVDAYLEYLVLLDASGKQAEAEKKIKEFLSEHPDEKRAEFILSVHYLRRNKKELALYFMNQLEKEKDFAWRSLLLNNFGMMALQDKNRQGAIAYFEKATKEKLEVSAPFANLGALYLQSKSYTKAEKEFRKAYQIESDFEDAALGLGVSLEGQGKFEEAHSVYVAFMERNPNALNIVYNDSLILGNRLKKTSDAAQQMLRYLQRGGKETAKAHEAMQNWR